MAANTYHMTAGLPVAKDAGQSPTSLVNTVFITAGLPPEVLEEEAVTWGKNGLGWQSGSDNAGKRQLGFSDHAMTGRGWSR